MLRERVRRFAAAAGFSGSRLQDVVLAVNEAADNIVEHGGGGGTLLAYSYDGGIWVELIDPAGTLTAERFADHAAVQPSIAAPGYGSWIIAQLCDDVVIDQHDGGWRMRLRTSLHPPRSTAQPTQQTSCWVQRSSMAEG
ncbi:ATP-binding protein [Nonomuraea recticatena]|uniref:ATP-binding protein n=1 Tax=Nonomuraea recticatena TaxID=46178 RepID=UPI0031F8859F